MRRIFAIFCLTHHSNKTRTTDWRWSLFEACGLLLTIPRITIIPALLLSIALLPDFIPKRALSAAAAAPPPLRNYESSSSGVLISSSSWSSMRGGSSICKSFLFLFHQGNHLTFTTTTIAPLSTIARNTRMSKRIKTTTSIHSGNMHASFTLSATASSEPFEENVTTEARRHAGDQAKREQEQQDEQPISSSVDDGNKKQKRPPRQERQWDHPKRRGKQQQQQKRNKNRPGYNSYLKVLLDQDTMERLQAVTVQIKDQMDTIMKEEEEEERKSDQNPSRSLSFPMKQLCDNKGVSAAMTICKEEDEKQPDPMAAEAAAVAANTNNATSSSLDDAGSDHEEKTSPFPTDVAEQPQQQQDQSHHLGRSRNKLQIKPRSLHSLHMTLFFAGETLSALPANELVAWHECIESRLTRSGFMIASPPVIGNAIDNDSGAIVVSSTSSTLLQSCSRNDNNKADNKPKQFDYWFRVKEFRIFPPRRNNLIVAVLEASPDWHQLHNDIRNDIRAGGGATTTVNKKQQQPLLSQPSSSPLLSDNSERGSFYSQGLIDILEYSKDTWTPHVTLANLQGKGSQKQMETLRQLLVDASSTTTTTTIMPKSNNSDCKSDMDIGTASMRFPAKSSGISMGGPIPQQVQLNWDFALSATPFTGGPTPSNIE